VFCDYHVTVSCVADNWKDLKWGIAAPYFLHNQHISDEGSGVCMCVCLCVYIYI